MQATCRMCGSPSLRSRDHVQGYQFVECGICGFVFAPCITDDHAADHHPAPSLGASQWGRGSGEFLEPALELIGPGSSLRILDFGTGCSAGPFALAERGHDVTSVDVTPPVHGGLGRAAESRLDLGLPHEHFDLVFSYQTFEHLPEPLPILLELCRLTVPGGLVMVHTDMEVPERQGGFARWRYVTPPSHCSFYSHRTFRVFCANHGLQMAHASPTAVILRRPARKVQAA